MLCKGVLLGLRCAALHTQQQLQLCHWGSCWPPSAHEEAAGKGAGGKGAGG